MVKNLPAMQETQVQSRGQEDSLEKEMATHSSILAGEFHGQRSLMGYISWGLKESDMTEQLTLSFSNNKVLLQHREFYSIRCDKSQLKRIFMCVTESLCCTAERHKPSINYTHFNEMFLNLADYKKCRPGKSS